MKLSRQIALLLLSAAITLGAFPTLSLAQDTPSSLKALLLLGSLL